MEWMIPAIAAGATGLLVLLGIGYRRTTRRSESRSAARRAELAAARGAAGAERFRLEALRVEAAEAAWAARALVRRAGRQDAALAAASGEWARREAELSQRIRHLAVALDHATRSTAVTSARLALLESELADMGRGAQREADLAEMAIAAARTEAEESARSAAAARLELAAATESLEHTRRRNLDLEHEARSLREQHAHLEERLQQTTEALEHSRALAEAMRTTADRLSAELERVRHDADLRVAAALASIATPQEAAKPDQPDPRLLAQQAEIRDLEERLATLSAARNAEARRLGDRIASLERLHLEIGARDERIAALESELKDSTAALESLRLETAELDSRLRTTALRLEDADRDVTAAASLRSDLAAARERVTALETAMSGATRATLAETEQLRAMLAAERERNVRLSRRTDLEPRLALEAALAAATRPLFERIARLEAELDSRPVTPPEDDVTRIKGIGPKIAAILAAAGVTSLRQIAAFTDADVARIGALLPVYPGRIVHDRWVEQARELVSGV